jgi:flagellar biosynthesis/type III secretory pathway protein FliH
MGLIKQADAARIAGNAVALHLGDLKREGEQILAAARGEAERVLREARAERERLVGRANEDGYREGYEQGYREGRARGEEDGQAEALGSTSAALAGLAESWGLGLARFEEERERMIDEARSEIVLLAAVFAERVTRRVVALDTGASVSAQIEAVLRAAIRPTRVVIAVHPEDIARAERALPALMRRFGGSGHAELMGDDTLERGSCVARLPGGGVIDASLTTQIDRLVEAMLPGDAGDRRAAGGDA